MNREAIYSSLFTLLSGAANFRAKGRRLKVWTEIPPESQPALFQVQKSETQQQKDGLPSRWLLALDVYVYVNCGEGQDANASAVLNPILDSLCAVLEPSASAGRQTLGGTVRHVRIAGTIQTDEGSLGSQAVAIIPIEILTFRDWQAQPT